MTPATPPRWLHALAIVTVVATLPLLFLGAEVTTKRVGMADPVGYRHPWELLQILADATGLGVKIEYSHRLAGFTVGTFAIVLAVGLWFFDRRRTIRWMGVLALSLVCVQGLLGKYRVDLNARFGLDLALVHGCFAQLVIAALVAVAVFTSRTWVDRADAAASPALRRWSLATVLLIYGQLVLGGVLRHKAFLLGTRLHLLGAFIVLAAVVWLVKLAWESERRASLAFSTKVLVALVGLQLLLGIETLLSRSHLYYQPGEPLSPAADWVRSGHYVAGTLVFATSIVIALKANRRPVLAESALRSPTLEAAL